MNIIVSPDEQFKIKLKQGISQGASQEELEKGARFLSSTLGLNYSDDSILGSIAQLRAENDATVHWDPNPIDAFGKFAPPQLIKGLLPRVIEDYAAQQGDLMGADPAGLAMAGLTVTCAAITDKIKLKMKRHDTWQESARIWCGLVGDPSSKKSPIIANAMAPIRSIEAERYKLWCEENEKYEALPEKEKEGIAAPTQRRILLEDTTPEAAQRVFVQNDDGMLVHRDELGGWFGSMDKYASGNAAMSDRAFYLQSYNGGPYRFDRVTRGVGMIPNLSLSLLGGIQPGPLARLVSGSQDDGLIQRLFTIILREGGIDKDVPVGDGYKRYFDLVKNLDKLTPQDVEGGASEIAVIAFDDDAQMIERALAAKIIEMQGLKIVNQRLATHIGKYAGMFGRIALAFHVIEHAHVVPSGGKIPVYMSRQTAQRASDFMMRFLFPHALAFYTGVLQMADGQADLEAVAAMILAREFSKVTVRDIQRGVRMQNLKKDDILPIMSQLEALLWVVEVQDNKGRPDHWLVNPACHRLFSEKARTEQERREQAKKSIKEARELSEQGA